MRSQIPVKLRALTQHRLFTVILAVALVAVNILSAYAYGRIDLTASNQYTVSDATKRIVRELKEPVAITAYFTKQLPPNLLPAAQYVKDLLNEYAAAGNVRIKFVDPATSEELKKEALERGIPEIEMQVLEKDQFKIQKGYLGLYIEYKDTHEAIPLVNQVDNLEYELTSIITKLSSDQLKKVGVFAGAGGDYTAIGRELVKTYDVVTVNLSEEKSLDGVNTLIIAGPKQELSERELYEIDQFIMRGGHVIALLDRVQIEGLQASGLDTKLEELLSSYGVTVNKDLVLDASNESVAFNSGLVQFILPYPLWPKLVKDNFSAAHPVMAKLQSISLPWASSLMTEQKEGTRLDTIAATTRYAFVQTDVFNLDPNQQIAPTDQRARPMIVEVSGVFTSYFKDKAIPPLTVEGSAQPKLPKAAEGPAPVLSSTGDPRIIVVGDSDFITDSFLQRFPENRAFFLNAVDYLTLGGDLISIRAKTLASRPLNNPSETAKNTIKILNMAVMPLLVVAAGLLRYRQRKKI